jgi:hypothetical protein
MLLRLRMRRFFCHPPHLPRPHLRRADPRSDHPVRTAQPTRPPHAGTGRPGAGRPRRGTTSRQAWLAGRPQHPATPAPRAARPPAQRWPCSASTTSRYAAATCAARSWSTWPATVRWSCWPIERPTASPTGCASIPASSSCAATAPAPTPTAPVKVRWRRSSRSPLAPVAQPRPARRKGRGAPSRLPARARARRVAAAH